MTKQRENGITWTEETWNVIRGCSRISKGCMNCYAEGVANRFKGEGQPYEGLIASTGQWNGKVNLIESKLLEPIRWKRPRLIFVNSMSDLFHESLSIFEIDRIFAVMAIAAQHTFQVLTKRAQRMAEYFRDEGWVSRVQGEASSLGYNIEELQLTGGLVNVWLGVSVEDQATADERIPLLIKTPAAVRWVSAEPLIGSVNLGLATKTWGGDRCDHCCNGDRCDDPSHYDRLSCPHCRGTGMATLLDWVVVGGESGTGARPMHPEWARSLRDQCVAAGVSFHFKQWGQFADQTDTGKVATNNQIITTSGKTIGAGCKYGGMVDEDWREQGAAWMGSVGKKAAGRELDGRTWDEYPVGYEREGAS